MGLKLSAPEITRLAHIILETADPLVLLVIGLTAVGGKEKAKELALGLVPGKTAEDKVRWLLTKIRPAFDSTERFLEVLDYLRGKWPEAGYSMSSSPASPADRIRGAMVTPMLVYSDTSLVCRQAAALKAAGYNAVASLVDLQTGAGQRDYIVKGRSATKLTSKGEENLMAVIDAGLVPVVIIRNDWAVRTKSGSVPSIGGQPTSQADFYSAARLRYEKQFLDSLQGYYKHIHIQLSIEPEHPASADFALQLARHLRAAGFANRLLINPLSPAVAAHKSIQAGLAAAGVEWARSHHGDSVPPDPVWNTDGDTALNGSNVRARVAKMQASGKDWILWTQSLANSHGDFPAEYMDVGLSEQTLPAMITGHEKGFLWKPVGENSRKLRVLLPKEWTGKVDKGSVEVWLGGERIESLTAIGVANGNREHFAGQKPGGSYNKGVSVRATEGGRTWAWAIPNPAGRGENLKAEMVGDGKAER